MLNMGFKTTALHLVPNRIFNSTRTKAKVSSRHVEIHARLLSLTHIKEQPKALPVNSHADVLSLRHVEKHAKAMSQMPLRNRPWQCR